MNKRDSIFSEFLYAKKLRFNEIEKSTGIRSNELAYFLKKLVDENILQKKDEYYLLTSDAEKNIPFFHKKGELSPLPVVLVGIFSDNKILLTKRTKRPYEEKWSLPGGRILLGESIEDAAKRIVKKKTFLDIEINGIHHIGNERVLNNGKIHHGFILLYVKARAISIIKEKENIQWFNPLDIPKNETIASDYYYATHKFEKINHKEFIVNN